MSSSFEKSGCKLWTLELSRCNQIFFFTFDSPQILGFFSISSFNICYKKYTLLHSVLHRRKLTIYILFTPQIVVTITFFIWILLPFIIWFFFFWQTPLTIIYIIESKSWLISYYDITPSYVFTLLKDWEKFFCFGDTIIFLLIIKFVGNP